MALPRTNSIGLNEHETLRIAEQAQPRMILTFYDHALLMRKFDSSGVREYPIDPSALSKALAAEAFFTTGLLTRETLLVARSGSYERIIEYRPPQVTGLWLEGSESALRIPLPGLILIRNVRDGKVQRYNAFAVKERPTSVKDRLFSAPFPNVSDSVCWGTVKQPSKKALASTSLEEDWKLFLGSPFGNHSPQNKSLRHPKDLRKLYFEIENSPAYPLDDLVESSTRLKDWLDL